MTTKHTPGPWLVTQHHDDETGWFEVRGPEGGQMASVAVVDDPHNARMISATPELLGALKGLLRLYQANDRDTTPEEIAAEYAIAKAEGQQ